jgi:hypothetical protein
MSGLLIGMISVAAFSSVGMALNAIIDFTNKDFKLGSGKGKGKGEDENEIKTIIKELKS